MATPWLSESEDGTWAVPAFVDRHCHPLFAERESSALDLTGCKTVEATIEALRAHLTANPGTQWLDAAPFEKSMSNAFLATTLDEVSRDVVITLHSSDRHALWVNSAALEIAGLLDSVPILVDGEVVCDSNGEASGLLLEWSAMKLVLDMQPLPSLQQDVETLEHAQRRLLAAGIVAMSDAWIDPGMGEVYLEASRQGKILMPVELWVRVSQIDLAGQLAYLESLLRQRDLAGNDHLICVAGVKIFLDGVLTSRSAALLEPYRDGSYGDLIWSNEEIDELLERVSGIDPRLRPHFHAVGDAAVRQAAEAISRAKSAGIWTGSRESVVAHAELVSKSDATRLSELAVEVVISPQWLVANDERQSLSEILSEATFIRLGDFSQMLDAGVTLTYGSDWPVSRPAPLDAVIAGAKHLRALGYALEAALEASWNIASARALGANPKQQFLQLTQNPLEVSRSDLDALQDLLISIPSL